MGFDANHWFMNVEYAALDRIGHETVRYVANIYKYYSAYRVGLELADQRRELLDELER